MEDLPRKKGAETFVQSTFAPAAPAASVVAQTLTSTTTNAEFAPLLTTTKPPKEFADESLSLSSGEAIVMPADHHHHPVGNVSRCHQSENESKKPLASVFGPGAPVRLVDDG